MADFGDDEYQQMLCLETANVRRAAWEVEPHGERRLVMEIACQSID
jgi:D-hexose-6-phosphate mutarotase